MRASSEFVHGLGCLVDGGLAVVLEEADPPMTPISGFSGSAGARVPGVFGFFFSQKIYNTGGWLNLNTLKINFHKWPA